MVDIYSLAIVGCGLTGTSMLYQLVDEIKKQKEKPAIEFETISVIVFEKENQPGPGLPYAQKNNFPFHLSNMPASDMSIVADRPDDFIDWINSKSRLLKIKYPELDLSGAKASSRLLGSVCLPRSVMGRYLNDRFNDAIKTAEEIGVPVSVRTMGEVTDIEDTGRYLLLKTVDLKTGSPGTVKAGRALLATGHWQSGSRKKGYFPSPWPASELLEQIPLSTTTGVLGTSLSGIDTVLTLLSDGTFSKNNKGQLKYLPGKRSRQVIMYSRNGLLPKVRGGLGIYKNRFFTRKRLDNLMHKKKRSLKLENVFHLLDRELESAYGKKIDWKQVLSSEKNSFLTLKADIQSAESGDNQDGDILWQTILSQATPLLKNAYLNLNLKERYRFERQFKSFFMTYVTVIPLINAQKMHAFMESGVLKICRLNKSYQLKAASTPYHFKICYQDKKGSPRAEHLHFVVNATGQSSAYRTNRSKLARNILSSGLVRLEKPDTGQERDTSQRHPVAAGIKEPGGLWIDPATHRIINKQENGKPVKSKKIFAVGIMTRGQVLNASMAHECSVSVKKVVQILINELFCQY